MGALAGHLSLIGYKRVQDARTQLGSELSPRLPSFAPDSLASPAARAAQFFLRLDAGLLLHPGCELFEAASSISAAYFILPAAKVGSIDSSLHSNVFEGPFMLFKHTIPSIKRIIFAKQAHFRSRRVNSSERTASVCKLPEVGSDRIGMETPDESGLSMRGD